MPVPALSYSGLRRVCAPVILRVYRLEVVGRERIPQAGPAIVVSNHESLLDPFVLGCAVDRELRFLAMSELWRNRAFAWAMNGLRAIPVERGRGDIGALAEARRHLEDGEVVAIFPQGAVRAVGPWHRGAAKLALATGASVVPIRLVGTARALSRGRVGLPRLAIVVGTPIEVTPGSATIVAAKRLTEQLRVAVESL